MLKTLILTYFRKLWKTQREKTKYKMTKKYISPIERLNRTIEHQRLQKSLLRQEKSRKAVTC